MKLNVSKYRDILSKNQLSDEYVRKATGLSEKTYLWILDNGFIECETLERIADVLGCKVVDILKPDSDGSCENVIEWAKDGKTATLSLSQRRTISKVKRLSEKYPDKCQVLADNKDGSICAHIPVEWVRIQPGVDLTEEQRREIALRLHRK